LVARPVGERTRRSPGSGPAVERFSLIQYLISQKDSTGPCHVIDPQHYRGCVPLGLGTAVVPVIPNRRVQRRLRDVELRRGSYEAVVSLLVVGIVTEVIEGERGVVKAAKSAATLEARGAFDVSQRDAHRGNARREACRTYNVLRMYISNDDLIRVSLG
jgi:hypothetical protein